MIKTTTHSIEGKPIQQYINIVTGETIIGANAIKDVIASFSDFFGGRSSVYENVLKKAKDTALEEMERRAEEIGANAIVGIDFDYETIGSTGSMIMVTCSGTAVII